MNDEKTNVIEVWRGRQILSMDSRLIDLGGLITASGEIGREPVTQLLHNLQLHSRYSQGDCVNSFYADKRILLKGCGFFGPLPLKIVGQSLSYKISVRLDMQWKPFDLSDGDDLRTRTLAQVFKNVTIDMTQTNNNTTIIPVDFESPISLDPNALKYNLVFRFEGPPTYELDATKLETNVEQAGINFFFWPGSKQMPVLRFCNPQES